MFEQAPTTPSKPTPAVATTPTPTVPPASPSYRAADEHTVDLYKRVSLSARQKIVLLVVTFVVLGALIGGGIWLYLTLAPFQTVTNTNSPTNSTSTIPLHELDTDKDGVRDIDEVKHGSNPEVADTDADGLNDYQEIITYLTQPTVADTDGDSYLDGAEVANGYDPNGPGKL